MLYVRTFCYILALVLLIGPTAVHAQNGDYEEWLRDQEERYQNFLDEQDEAFMEFLEEQWSAYDIDRGPASQIDTKPITLPEAEPAESQPTPAEPDAETQPDREAPEEATELDAPEETPDPDPTPEAPAPDAGEPDAGERADALPRSARLSFHGTPTLLPYDASFTPSLREAPSKSSIATFWGNLAETDYEALIETLHEQRRDLNLSDWGYYQYVRTAAATLYDDSDTSLSNSATLWTWFVMMQSGYDARVGYANESVLLLLPAEQRLYGHPFMETEGQRYYVLNKDAHRIEAFTTYEGSHEAATQKLSFASPQLPHLGDSTSSRTISFSYQGSDYEFEIDYNSALVNYLQSYPTVELGMTFEAPMSDTARNSLQDALMPHLEERSPREALNFLLRFVQYATEYETDEEQFGETRFMFPEEALAATATDCDDRAPLFAYLARTLLGYETIGLLWEGEPGHAAVAIGTTDDLQATASDRTYTVDGHTYILADPTFIGANLGMEMPFIENRKPQIVASSR